jgi:hypothetical protein
MSCSFSYGEHPAVCIYHLFSALSFLLTKGAWDKVLTFHGRRDIDIEVFKAQEWTTYTDAQRATVKAQYAAAGIKLIVSAFGSTETPTTSGINPVTMVSLSNYV